MLIIYYYNYQFSIISINITLDCYTTKYPKTWWFKVTTLFCAHLCVSGIWAAELVGRWSLTWGASARMTARKELVPRWLFCSSVGTWDPFSPSMVSYPYLRSLKARRFQDFFHFLHDASFKKNKTEAISLVKGCAWIWPISLLPCSISQCNHRASQRGEGIDPTLGEGVEAHITEEHGK